MQRGKIRLGLLLALGSFVLLCPGVAGAGTKSYTVTGLTPSMSQFDRNIPTKYARHKFVCDAGSWVMNSGTNSGTIFDEPYFDTSGTSNEVMTTWDLADSAAWGHIGSRLATAIWVFAADRRDQWRELPFSISVKCTTNQADAWVVFG